MTSGRSRRLQHVQRLLDVFRHRLDARRIGAFRGHVRLVGVARAGDDVVGDVEIGRARPAVDRLPDRHLDIERDAVDVLDRVRPFADRRRGQHLALFLEGAHAVAVGLRRAADQHHRPAVLLRVGQAGEAVDDAGTGHDDARARAAGQVADGAGGIGRGLLVAHADIGEADLLRRLGERTDREPDDAEHVFHALFLEALRQQVGAFDLSHVSSCQRAAAIGPVTKNPNGRHITHMWRRGKSAAAAVSPPVCCRDAGPCAASRQIRRFNTRGLFDLDQGARCGHWRGCWMNNGT